MSSIFYGSIPDLCFVYQRHNLSYFYTYLLTYLLTLWSRVLLENLTDSQLLKKLLAFYGT